MEIVVRRAIPHDGARIADIYNQGVQARTATFETDLRTVDDQKQWTAEHAGVPAVLAVVSRLVVGFAHAAEPIGPVRVIGEEDDSQRRDQTDRHAHRHQNSPLAVWDTARNPRWVKSAWVRTTFPVLHTGQAKANSKR